MCTRFKILLIFLLFISFQGIAQDTIPKKIGDLQYREDQFYVGLTYNLISSKTPGLHPEGLSGGVNFGFVRDMPINNNRNISIGIGAGISLDQYGSTLYINQDENSNTYFKILSDTLSYKYNRFQTAIVEVPLELRWRTSTPTSYKFWRAHLGFRVGYAFWNRSRFKDETGSYTISNISEYEKLRLGTTLSVGYNKFNLFVYYSINPFYSNKAIITEGDKVDFKSLKLGFIFYIL